MFTTGAPFAPPGIHHEVKDWQDEGRQLAQQGSSSIDACVELVCLKESVPALRGEILQNWGIANGAAQIEAWAAVRDLPSDDPIRTLSNSQRMAIFLGPLEHRQALLDSARQLLSDGRPASRITDDWVGVQVKAFSQALFELKRENRTRFQQLTPSQRLAQSEAVMKQQEQKIAELEAQVFDLLKLIEAMENADGIIRKGEQPQQVAA
ncbi:MAG: hypothetical protein ACPGSE_00215 [Synechococcus sp.]